MKENPASLLKRGHFTPSHLSFDLPKFAFEPTVCGSLSKIVVTSCYEPYCAVCSYLTFAFANRPRDSGDSGVAPVSLTRRDEIWPSFFVMPPYICSLILNELLDSPTGLLVSPQGPRFISRTFSFPTTSTETKHASGPIVFSLGPRSIF